MSASTTLVRPDTLKGMHRERLGSGVGWVVVTVHILLRCKKHTCMQAGGTRAVVTCGLAGECR